MTKYILAYISTAIVFFPVDLLWLGVIAQKHYQRLLGDMLAINWPAAIVFYLIYIAGIVVFAVGPALAKQSLGYAALYGALFGFFCYATYDLTNLATMKGFPAAIVIPDILWGVVLTAVSASGGYLICKALAKLFSN
ncbi:MAG: DUF2177 family protein [Marinicaulis sp.]|nr:DUF2177 family protein [Marinicaulis sp.]